ncbi:MAG: OadG family protein [Bacteroidales bacterium]|nr:OadG family protein [Bacteroidales bacterium]
MDSELLKNGISIAVTGYLIVFAALTFFYATFYFLPKIIKIRIKKKLKSENRECAEKVHEEISGATVAAISSAIYLYLSEQHDNESYELTIKRISKRYSPWSSKIYSMNNLNKRT